MYPVQHEFGPASRFKASAVACACALLSQAAIAQLPTGGAIVEGAGSISSSGATMTIQQTTDRMTATWQNFSVGQGNTVNFVQPSANAVALNRVLGSDVSLIQGAITANGKVFLVNPNGILFTPTAQVDVGGLVASTLNISTADFMAGNYRFEGASTQAVTNQGSINAAPGGTIALIAARIINDGTLTAQSGNVLLGAGSRVLLDMGGPVRLQVENDTLETLIANGGAIRADGGRVYLTSQAAATLASSVINHTGVIEANALSTGEKGEVVLFAHGGHMNLGGAIRAEGGFVETSGKYFSSEPGATVKAGHWLIDPVNVTIDSALATSIQNALGSADVTITTDGSNSPSTASGEASGAGNINVNSPISWSANKLTLSAHADINVNSDLTATGTGGLTFLFGQGTPAGTGSTYAVNGGAKILIPSADKFQWKKGSGGTLTNLIFDNGNLRFGNGTQTSINNLGQLEQPFYFDNVSVVNGSTRNGWFQLTFSNYPLDLELGVGGTGTSSWNRNGTLLNTQTNMSSAIVSGASSLDISGFRQGYGTIIASTNLDFGSGVTMKVANTYNLGQTANYIETVTRVTNVSTSAVENVRLWVGTRDDYIATRDSQFKFKGNLGASGFAQIATQDTQSKALKITEFNDGQGAAVLFYSTSSGADTAIARCCSFTNATGIDPRTSEIVRGGSVASPSPEDGSYALFIRLNNLAANQSDSMTWYYAAAPVTQLASVVTSVSSAAGVTVTPTTTTTTVSLPLLQAVQRATQQPTEVFRGATTTRAQINLGASGRPPAQVALPQAAPLPVVDLSGGLAFVELAPPPATNTVASATNTTRTSSGSTNAATDAPPPGVTGTDPMGFMRVFVTRGGINMPDSAAPDAAAESARRAAQVGR